MTHYKKRLVYILHDIAVGGVEVALLSAVPMLCRQYDLKIIVLGKINPSLVAHFTSEQKEVFHVFPYKVYLYPFYIRKIINFVSGLRPDVLVCSLWRSMLIGYEVKKKNKEIKFFTFIHSIDFFHLADRIFTSRALRKADVVLTDSYSSFQFIQNNFQLKCPIRTVSFITNVTPAYRKRELLSNNGNVRMMFLGRMDKVKNLPLSIKIISYLRKNGYNVFLDIYGRWDNAYQDTIDAIRADSLEEFIHLKGEISPSEKFELFNGYDFYLQLSAFEGMAMSVAEAMQNGLPCIVSPVGEIPNYSNDMESAIFVDIWHPEKWDVSISKVERVLNDSNLYKSISERCWGRFKGRKIFADSLIESLEYQYD